MPTSAFPLFAAVFYCFCISAALSMQDVNPSVAPESRALEVDVSTSAVDGSVHPTETTNTDQEFSFEVNSPVVPAAEDEIDGTAKPPFWISKKFHITCCLGGIPIVNHPELAQNFSFHLLSFVIDEKEDAIGQNCRLFKGSYLLPPPRVFNAELSYAVQVVCKCPDMVHTLDKNCRRLPTCLNNGFRSLIDPRKCLCLQPFFGDKCEKFCDQGQRLRGVDGRDYCSCTPLYRGEECRDVVCMNSGTEDGAGRCVCPQNFLGFHCEIDANKTLQHQYGLSGHSSRFQRFGTDQHSEMFTRDISGTIFSLIMIVVLVVSMYLLMKHRMQMHTRYLRNPVEGRRPDLLNACNFSIPPTNSANRRVELLTADRHAEFRSLPFRSLNIGFGAPVDGGPPPYASTARQTRHSRMRNEALPPLPSYEDATKMPTLGSGQNIEENELTTRQPSDEANEEDACEQQHQPAESRPATAVGIDVHQQQSREGCEGEVASADSRSVLSSTSEGSCCDIQSIASAGAPPSREHPLENITPSPTDAHHESGILTGSDALATVISPGIK